MTKRNNLFALFQSILGHAPEEEEPRAQETTMILRNDVLALYRLTLGREPESEEVVIEKRRSGSASDVGFGMMMSDEFITKNIKLLQRVVS